MGAPTLASWWSTCLWSLRSHFVPGYCVRQTSIVLPSYPRVSFEPSDPLAYICQPQQAYIQQSELDLLMMCREDHIPSFHILERSLIWQVEEDHCSTTCTDEGLVRVQTEREEAYILCTFLWEARRFWLDESVRPTTILDGTKWVQRREMLLYHC